MRVEIDDKSGFCFGVVRAITEAERALGEGGTVYSLGDIVHNRIEVQRLEKLGLSTVTHADMPRLTGRRLFIRAHGEPPTTYARAAELGIEVIDATCPVVARLQARVVKAHERMRPTGGQVVILGKRGHAEVVGLTGQVADPTIVIEREEDLELIDFSRPVLPYLTTAVRNRSIDCLRSRKSRGEGTCGLDTLDGYVRCLVADRCEEEFDLSWLRHEIDDGVSQLSEQCRRVFLLSRVTGLKNREIAERLNISVKAVEKHIGVALSKLRLRLSRSGFFNLFL